MEVMIGLVILSIFLLCVGYLLGLEHGKNQTIRSLTWSYTLKKIDHWMDDVYKRKQKWTLEFMKYNNLDVNGDYKVIVDKEPKEVKEWLQEQ